MYYNFKTLRSPTTSRPWCRFETRSTSTFEKRFKIMEII